MLCQHVPDFIGAPHPVRHQAHIRWAHPEIVSHTRIQPKVQFVNAKEVLFIQFAFRFSAVCAHHPFPPMALYPRYSIPTYFTDVRRLLAVIYVTQRCDALANAHVA